MLESTVRLDSSSVVMTGNSAGLGDDIYTEQSTLTCTSSCVANEVPSSPCSFAKVPDGQAACPIACGPCTTCPAGTASSVVGSVDAGDCACNLPYFLSNEGSKQW